MRNLREEFGKAQSVLTATLFPARCTACRAYVVRHGSLCAACWGQIHFITDPVCMRCGLPARATRIRRVALGAAL